MADWPDVSRLQKISDHQREQLRLATRERIGLLTGGPGTGKSTVIGALACVLDDAAFVAPTGRAGVRMQELLLSHGLDFPCSTIHRLLSPQRNGHDNEGWGFFYNRFNKLKVRYIICDEASMNDGYITRCLLEACGPETHILFVGDPDQLPPVGKGKPFLDMINSGLVPHGHFRETHRFAGRIATVCQQINRGEKWIDSEAIDTDAEFPENIKHLQANTQADIQSLLCKLIAERFPLRTPHVARDVQVIVPRNSRGALSQESLNIQLQSILNPCPGEFDPNLKFRANDKVVCLKNGTRHTVRECPFSGTVIENLKDYCANGEIGYIQKIDTKGMVILFEGHIEPVFFGRADWNEVRLAYALTGHKCQGGQWPFVVVIADDSQAARFVCSRAWWYTAFSRGKKLVVSIGKRSVIDSDCLRVDMLERRTHLASKLLRDIA